MSLADVLDLEKAYRRVQQDKRDDTWPDIINYRDYQRVLEQNLEFLRNQIATPNLEIIEGHYSEHPKWMRVANPKKGQPKYIEVIKTEEKGSDVNLAVHLLHDGYQGRYELGVVVSNDSDLLSSIQIVQNDLGLAVGILNPQKHPSKDLKDEALFVKQIRQGVIKASQFPPTMTDAKGSFHKPKDW